MKAWEWRQFLRGRVLLCGSGLNIHSHERAIAMHAAALNFGDQSILPRLSLAALGQHVRTATSLLLRDWRIFKSGFKMGVDNRVERKTAGVGGAGSRV